MSSRSHLRTRLLGAALAVAALVGLPTAPQPDAGAPAPGGPAGALGPGAATALVRTATASASARAVASARAEGIDLESRTTYTLDTSASAVHVVFEATLTNQSPPVYGPFSISYSYLPDFGVPLVKEAVNVTATRADGSALPIAVEDLGNPIIASAVVDLEPDLMYQDVQSIRLSYDIPPVGARTPGISRLNSAFATFPVFAIGDPGRTSVEVVVPDRFDVELIGSELERTERDDLQVFASSAIADPDTFDVSVVARDDDELVAREVDLGRHDATVLGWPGDDQWVGFVADHLDRGVPAMEELLGLDWPAARHLEVVETVSPYLYGYAGWYLPSDALMEIGDELDGQVVLHELSHAWFNHDLYDSRWVNEALANVYAARALRALGTEPPTPLPTSPSDAGALRLNDWSSPALQAELSFEQEAYGYETSWGLLEQVVAEIGMERLGDVVRASEAGLLTYAAPGRRDDHPGLHGWRQLLDLLTDLGGSTTAEGLFRSHVVAEDQVADLDARAAARAAYAQLVAETDGWVPPLPVRAAMARWAFDVATDHVGAVRELLPLRAEVLAALDGLGIEPPARLRETWERAERTADLRRDLTRALDAVGAYRATVARNEDRSGLAAAVGLTFTDLDGKLDDARAQLAAGDFAAAARTVAEVDGRLDDAATAALARVAALLAIVAVLVAVRRSGLRPPPDWPSRLGPHTVTSPPS